MNDIFTGTPPSLTYEHELVRQAWMVVWQVTMGALALVLGWIGLTLIVQEHLGRPSVGWREMFPRLALGVAAASSSLWWCALIVDLSDAISGYVASAMNVTPGDLVRAPVEVLLRAVEAGSVGMAQLAAVIYLVYGLFVVVVLVQMAIRLALIDLLVALAPIAMGLWILPHTSGWGRHWLRLFMTTVFQQSIQLIALALGFGFLEEFAVIGNFEALQDLVWKLLISASFVYLATRVPSMLGQAGTFEAWIQTIYFAMGVAGGMSRTAKALAVAAGGSFGGPAGVAAGAAGAGLAGGAIGTVGSAVRSAAQMSSGSNEQGGSPRSAGE